MFGFFEKGISYTQGIQLLNATVITVASYSLLTSTEGGAAEFGLMVVTHAFSAYCLNDAGFGTKLLGAGANLFGLGATYAGLTSGCSNASWALQAMSACGNAFNTFSMLFIDRPRVEDEAPAAHSMS
ncbi:hypothetical protein [Legionella worsleiensis]|uniref:Uncharacterized protein n=1 Tax=Legionella worsleiensis TaxID=45076 RepID=A0A0W1AL13_9GAMM|nr:hypothetical protein [Legionella worsleiensis]KTD81966.1 hypothetical protein Lwor_0269 [Legionella worsleiensis]STY31343.1 Uncharacterised protein [Legionella worsleiensis]